MIAGNINDLKDYDFLPDNIKQAFLYAAEHNLQESEKGSYQLAGEKLFVNIVEYQTTTAEKRFWEAHKQYLDIHLVLAGEERINLNHISRMVQKEFVEKDDYLPLEGEFSSYIELKTGDFLICYPNDGHMTGLMVNEPQQIKKAIFKVMI